ncbi:zinc-dependent alcohol dehydrogenase [Nocardia mexicana]|uniref:(R,R)-butanediol dehydrogenase/meso-butanediol dehydrogenase/diacetyl reductase/L-iditol 2-dehydrogenase n=1 Tax=Nocardia mexicana TaxID=279262 RepID=A0A370HEB3_9NOCA|nr:alcohol dehydrogenase catalytic domain-containing protein [Nocardia mexicana]RDI55587.1 (R,R)-butanediol dehydrogenase/meso-butanediol dehydrogenase/diacetyl reductase/L-iditol 2-dehydrogenase [Nocardia mexicana]
MLSVPSAMTAAVLVADREIVVRQLPVPSPADDQVLVRVAVSGVCGSDVATYRGLHPYKRPPIVLGHELCGRVAAVGGAVTDIAVGERVTSAAFSWCGDCPHCRRGAVNLCRARRNLCHLGWHGSFADYVVLDRTMVFRLPGGLDAEAGALAEPLSIATHAIRMIDAPAGKSLVVLGSGSIGLCCVLVARTLGIGDTVCVDIGAPKRRLAVRAGADVFVDARTGPPAASVPGAPPGGADVTVVAAGYPGVLADARAVTKPGGLVVVVSYFDTAQEFDLNAMVSAELTVRFSALSTPADFHDVVSWLAGGVIDPTSLVTHRFPLTRAGEAMELADRAAGLAGKVTIHCAETEEIP